jgi:hypothetical protein
VKINGVRLDFCHSRLVWARHYYKLNTEYFPSYEIMMDELRDHRFYAEDMLHPSQWLIDYIWRFKETTVSEIAFSGCRRNTSGHGTYLLDSEPSKNLKSNSN